MALLLLWGALWGAAQGMWLIGPIAVRVHRIAPATRAQWLMLDAVLVALPGATGALFSLFAGLLVIAWPIVRRRPYRDFGWALGLALAALVPLSYLAAAALIEWRYFARVPQPHGRDLLTASAALATISLALVVVYRCVTRRATRVPIPWLASILGGIVLLGAATLPYRVPALPRASVVDGGPLLSSAERTPNGPLLVVGVDSGNWETIDPLLARGALPTIGRLVAGGVHGTVEALWPPYWSAPAWAAILTGHPRDEVGIYADLTVFAPGLPPFDAPLDGDFLLDPFFLVEWKLLGSDVIQAVHPPRSLLRRPPVWALLAQAGIETGVIRFDFTYPADGQGTFVISNRVGHDEWGLARATANSGDRLVSPVELADELLAPFADSVPFDETSFAMLFKDAQRERQGRSALELKMLRVAFDIDRRTIEAGAHLLERRPDPPFLAIYLPGFDGVCHAYWEYRFPDAYGDSRPSADEIAEFGDVIDRYLEFIDSGLARLIGGYRTRPNVLVISDHGHQATLDHPLWRGWHGPRGIFIGAGPTFLPRPGRLAVSYYDFVPTVADVMGLQVPDGMHGHSVVSR